MDGPIAVPRADAPHRIRQRDAAQGRRIGLCGAGGPRGVQDVSAAAVARTASRTGAGAVARSSAAPILRGASPRPRRSAARSAERRRTAPRAAIAIWNAMPIGSNPPLRTLSAGAPEAHRSPISCTRKTATCIAARRRMRGTTPSRSMDGSPPQPASAEEEHPEQARRDAQPAGGVQVPVTRGREELPR